MIFYMGEIRVTCAIILINGKTLVVQRSEKMKLPLKWEFPGGKIEKGESEVDCIKREIKEELNIEIELIARLSPSKHSYPNLTVELIPYKAKYIEGDIRLSEHKQYLILDKDELKNLDWAEADIPILNEYINL